MDSTAGNDYIVYWLMPLAVLVWYYASMVDMKLSYERDILNDALVHVVHLR